MIQYVQSSDRFTGMVLSSQRSLRRKNPKTLVQVQVRRIRADQPHMPDRDKAGDLCVTFQSRQPSRRIWPDEPYTADRFEAGY